MATPSVTFYVDKDPIVNDHASAARQHAELLEQAIERRTAHLETLTGDEAKGLYAHSLKSLKRQYAEAKATTPAESAEQTEE